MVACGAGAVVGAVVGTIMGAPGAESVASRDVAWGILFAVVGREKDRGAGPEDTGTIGDDILSCSACGTTGALDADIIKY